MMQSENYKNIHPRQRESAESSRVNQAAARMQGAATRVNVRLPTIDENEIGTIIRKTDNNAIHNGEVIHYFEDENCTLYAIRMGENEKINQR